MHPYRTFVLFLLLATAVQLQAAVKPITIEKPAGGEMYLPGQTQTVVLNARTRSKSVLIELSRDGGATFETLGTIDNTVTDKAARNRLQWTVDEPYTSDAVIRATSTDPRKPGDGTSDSFAIGAPTGDGSGELYVLRSGDTMTGTLTLSGDPSGNLQAATKQYADNLVAAATAGFPKCRASNSSNISIGTSSETALALDSEAFDTDAIHDTSTNTSRLTCKTAGVYIIGGNVEFAANGNGTRTARIRLNGTTFIGSQKTLSPTLSPAMVSVVTIYSLSVGDYVELTAIQSSGGNLDVLALSNSPTLWMAKLP